MWYRLFHATANRRAAEAETRRVCDEIRRERDARDAPLLRQTHIDLERTQEIMGRLGDGPAARGEFSS